MLTLNDGRSELWQWDTGRTLTVDADCSQVHFSNKAFGRSIDVDVVGGTAIIPDVLLQTDKDFTVWAFVGTAENGYTKISKTFKVNRRNKPADYVFTPTDQMTLQMIQRQIGDLADLTTEAKDTLVAAINEAAKSGSGGGGTTDHTKLTNRNADDQHPMSAITGLVGALGGKVSVADIIDNLTTNAANKPLSAAQGVAIKTLIDAIKIPEKLPNPHALTFTGAVSGSYDGSEAKTINIPSGGGDIALGITGATVGQIAKITAVDENGKPTEWEAADMPSGGGGASYRSWSKVWTLAVAEDIAGFTASNIDLDGKSEIMIVFISDSTASRTMTNGRLRINGVDAGKALFNTLPLKKDSHSFVIIGRADVGIEYTTMQATAEYQTYPWQGEVKIVHRMVSGTGSIIQWTAGSTIEITQSSATLGKGITIEIYVR